MGHTYLAFKGTALWKKGIGQEISESPNAGEGWPSQDREGPRDTHSDRGHTARARTPVRHMTDSHGSEESTYHLLHVIFLKRNGRASYSFRCA